MKTIYKYELLARNYTELVMPAGAKIIKVDSIEDKPYIWAEVEVAGMKVDVRNEELEERIFCTYGTGHEFRHPDNRQEYIGTYFLRNGMLVFHVYEIKTR